MSDWQYQETTRLGQPVFRVTGLETGEIIEFGSFTGLFDGYQERGLELGRISGALGPKVERRWENGDDVDLEAEIKSIRDLLRRIAERDSADATGLAGLIDEARDLVKGDRA